MYSEVNGGNEMNELKQCSYGQRESLEPVMMKDIYADYMRRDRHLEHDIGLRFRPQGNVTPLLTAPNIG